MFNNIKLISKAFDYIKKEEKKLNYEYEPHFEKEDDNWKRHLFFFELKKDFIKDVTELGFCPYIQKPCEEQRRDKNIMRFRKVDNYVRADYIKNLYKKITSNNFNSVKRQKSVSPKNAKYTLILKKNNSMKDINYKNKLKNSNTFLSQIYSKIKNRKREINNLKLNKNIKQTAESTENLVTKKSSKNDDREIEAESFIYEQEKSSIKYNNYYELDKERHEELNDKDDSISNIPNNKNNQISYEMNSGEIKKTGWRMTTTLDNVKLFRNLKGSFPLHKNIDNHNNDFIRASFLSNKKKMTHNKFRVENRNSLSSIRINKSPIEKVNKSKIYYKKNVPNEKIKIANNKKYKLFSHLRKMKYEI